MVNLCLTTVNMFCCCCICSKSMVVFVRAITMVASSWKHNSHNFLTNVAIAEKTIASSSLKLSSISGGRQLGLSPKMPSI